MVSVDPSEKPRMNRSPRSAFRKSDEEEVLGTCVLVPLARGVLPQNLSKIGYHTKVRGVIYTRSNTHKRSTPKHVKKWGITQVRVHAHTYADTNPRKKYNSFINLY